MLIWEIDKLDAGFQRDQMCFSCTEALNYTIKVHMQTFFIIIFFTTHNEVYQLNTKKDVDNPIYWTR